MNINFTAIDVEYVGEIDEEIVQVSFDEDSSQDPFNRNKCYLMISQNYEFPGKPTLEWHDGKNEGGGSGVLTYKLTKDLLELTTTNGLNFIIQYNCPEKIYYQIQEFFVCEFDNDNG